MDLSTVAYELYGIEPGEFVSARDARASEAKKAGDRELASAIKQLRRPTTGAWLANLLARERRDRVTELVDLGDDMRRAQHDLAGKDLRHLSTLRRELVTALAAEAKKIAGAHGHEVNEPSLHEVETTLEAAVADRAAGEALVSGNLTISLRYSGFGSVDLTGVVASPPATPPVTPPATPPAGTRSPKTAKALNPAKAPKAARQGPRNEVRSIADRRREKKIEGAEALLARARAEESVAQQAVSDADVQLEAARKRKDLAERNLERVRDRVAATTAELERLRSTSD